MRYAQKAAASVSEQTKTNFKQTVKIINSVAYNEKIDLAKQPYYSSALPRYVYKIIADYRLFDIGDPNEAAKIFLQAMEAKRLRGNRILRIFNKLKPLIFPKTTIKPSTMYFDQKKPAQVRVPQMGKIETLVNYVENNPSEYSWPILLAYYTGLRSSEVISVKVSTLLELQSRKKKTNVVRKNGAFWEPIYFDQFNSFIDQIINNFKEEVQLAHIVDSKIFPFKSRTLHYFVCRYYIEANGELPVLGFGIHVFRYYVASKLVESDDIHLAQTFLGHKSTESTKHYLKLDDRCFINKFEKINKDVEMFADLLDDFDQNVNQITPFY